MEFKVGKYYKWGQLKCHRSTIIKIVRIGLPFIYYSYPLFNTPFRIYEEKYEESKKLFVEINLTTKEYLRLKYEK